MRVVGISGRLKRESSNSALLAAIATRVTGELELWERIGELPHFSPDLDGGEAVESLRRAVGSGDAVLIATPEYAGGMPGALKNALDWLVGSGELYGKTVVVVSAAPSVERGVNARRWVEDVARMQGARVAASFTVPASPADPESVHERARSVWRQVVEACDSPPI